MFYPKSKGNTWCPKAAYMGFKNEFVVPQAAASIPRFSMLVVGMFCSIAISSVYSFSLITGKLQRDFHYNQNDITTISTVGICVGYCLLPFSFIYDYIGPKPIFAIAILLTVIGTLFFSLIFDERIGHSVAGMSIINAILNLGSGLYDLGSVITVLSWFPLDRGLVIACMKTMTGLGSSVVVTLYNTYFNGDRVVYMYFLLVWCTFIGLVAIVTIYLPPYHMTGWRSKNYTEDDRMRAAAYMSLYMREKAPIKRFIIAFIFVFSLLILICTRSVIFVFIKDPGFNQLNPPTVIMVVLYICLLLVITPLRWLDIQPAWYDRENRERNTRDEAAARAEECRSELSVDADVAEWLDGNAQKVKEGEEAHSDLSARREDDEEQAPQGCCAKLKAMCNDEGTTEIPEPRNRAEAITALQLAHEIEKISPQYQTGFFRNACRPVLIGMWVTGFCISGFVHVVLLNNEQIYIAIAANLEGEDRRSLYLALTSIGSAVGRLIMAFIEVGISSTPVKRRIPITALYLVGPIICVLSCLFFLVLPVAGLILPMFFAGLGNGFYAACEVITARTIFSIDIGKHYNSLFFFEMIAVIFMNRFLFGEIMTKNSTTLPNGEVYCFGRKQCVQTTFIVLLAVNVVGFAASVAVWLSYRAFSRKEIQKRRERRAELERKLVEFGGAIDVRPDGE